jgi:cell division protein FtsB
MENEKTYVLDKVIDALIEKKIDNFCSESKDFVIPHELTVTITLKEYRDLVASKASHNNEVSEITLEKRKLEKELETYKTENDMLTKKIMRMENDTTAKDDSEVRA